MSDAAPTTLYFISDLHIGGDGALAKCKFEAELVEFLRKVAEGPQPAEILIVGDAFGFWELTEEPGVGTKLDTIVANHPDLFRQMRETGEHCRITLLPGNHDYDLACVPAYADALALHGIRLEPVESLQRKVAGRTIWIEHGQQHDEFNRSPEFGNRWALPFGYWVTSGIVASAGKSAEGTRSRWLDDVESVQPNQDIPYWVLSNHFYKEITPWLRWGTLPFLLLFGLSAALFWLRAAERLTGYRSPIFEIDLQPLLGFPGRVLDFVQFVNSAVLATLLVLAIPGLFLLRNVRRALERFGLWREDGLALDQDGDYVAAARRIFAEHPDVAVYVYGHTHTPSQKEVDGRLVLNTGSWLKRLEHVPVRLGRLPGVWVPSYCLNWFEITEDAGAIRIRYRVVSKEPPRDLTLLERLLILGRRPPPLPAIPAETRIA
ncbi:MAG: metallophosphoesterase [Alphaproteobacteria bacterium]